MNGMKALAIAAALGLAGAALNWYYLQTKAQHLEKIVFLSIAPGVTIRPGDSFGEEKFAPLAIPAANVSKQLRDEAILYADRQTVIGMKAVKLHGEREILLRQDLKTPPPALALAENERAMWIPVDTRTFVPSLVSAGDTVSFVVGGSAPPAGSPGGPGFDEQENPVPTPVAAGSTELIGKFKVLSVGNRLGSADVLKASGIPQMQENVMTISVTVVNDQLEPKAAKLWKLLQASGYRQAGVVLHPRKPD